MTSLPPIPRPVRLNARGVAVCVIAILLLAGALVGGPLLYLQAAREAAYHKALIATAVSTAGEVVRTRRTRGKAPHQTIIYRYAVAGQPYQGRAEFRSALRPGTPVQVFYVPSEPGRSWIAGHPPEGVPLWMAPLVLVVASLAPALMYRRLRQERRLLIGGRFAVARVTGVKRIHKGEARRNRVWFEFTLLNGATRQGHVDLCRRGAVPDSTLTILYDPDDPRRTMPYPGCFYRIGA